MFAKGISLPVSQITCWRSLVAAATLLLFLLWSGRPVKLKRLGHYGIMAVLGVLLCSHWLTYFEALKISTAAVTILSLHTYPVFTALVEPFLFGEKLKKIDVVLVLVVFSAVLIMTPEISLSNATTRGIVLGILSGLFFMTRNLMTRKYIQEYSGSTLMFWQVAVTGLILLPAFFSSERTEYSPQNIGLLVLLGIVFTALPHTLFSASFKSLSAKTASVLATLLPFYGALFGYLIHDEQVTSRTAIGGAIILACVVFETVKSVGQQTTSARTVPPGLEPGPSR